MNQPPSLSKRYRSPWMKALIGIGISIAALALLIASVIAFESWLGTCKWNRYKQELEAKGEKFDIQSLRPPAVPDDKNFAKHPIIARIFENKSSSPQSDSFPIVPGAADARNNKSEYGPNMKRNESQQLLDLWGKYYVGHSAFPQALPGSSPAEVVRAALSKYDRDVDDLQLARRSRTQCRHPLDYEAGYRMPVPHFASYKSLITVLKLRCFADIHLARTEKAFEELRLGLFVSDTLTNDHQLVSQLVRMSFDALLIEVIREGLCLKRWNPTQMEWFEEYFSRRDYLAEYQSGMRGDRNFQIYAIESLRQGRLGSVTISDEGVEENVPLYKAFPQGIFSQNIHTIARFHQEFLIPSAVPGRREISKKKAEEFAAAIRSLKKYSPYTVFARLLLPGLSKAAPRTACWQTCGDTVMVACAIERYRLTQGTLPENLELLTPQFLPFLPKDGVSGKPLTYRIENQESYQIYSFGWDEVDDGGEMNRFQPETGDWGIKIAPISPATNSLPARNR